MARKKSYSPPPIENRQFTVEEIDLAIEKFGRRKREVEGLDPEKIRYDDAHVDNTVSNIRNTIREIFGENSPEFNEHGYHEIWHGGHIIGEPDHILQNKFAQGIPRTIIMLDGLISRLQEKREDLLINAPNSKQIHKTDFDNRRIFIVHGHDEESKEKLARFLEALELDPIILHEQANEGKTIIEKFETHADVAFAVVLLTPDDVGGQANEPDKALPRARQNVIFELGFFIGKLGRNRVCALHKGDVELPSDYHGILYVSMDESNGWKLLLAKELRQVGLNIDLNAAI